MRKLTREQKRQITAIAAQKDGEIDLTEMPEVTDWSGAEVGKSIVHPRSPSLCDSIRISSSGSRAMGEAIRRE